MIKLFYVPGTCALKLLDRVYQHLNRHLEGKDNVVGNHLGRSLVDYGKNNESSFSFLNQRLIEYGDRQYDNETNCFTGWDNWNVRL